VTTLVWFRNDLRLADNPALAAAADAGGPIVPLYLFAPDEAGEWRAGAASRWWLHESLRALDGDLRRLGSRLVIARGAALGELRRVIGDTGAAQVLWNRCYEPAAVARDAAILEALQDDGVAARTFNGGLLAEPATIANREGKPFQVFTPFWRRMLERGDPPPPRPAPRKLPALRRWPDSLAVEDLALLPQVGWYRSLAGSWQPGEAGAAARLDAFVERALRSYDQGRDRPDLDGTSRLSPHLHFGEVSPSQVWAAACSAAASAGLAPAEARHSRFLAELGWREFAHHLLYHFPHTPTEPLRGEFRHFPWRDDPGALRAWQRGRTGVPMVDAGMRQLWQTGWMHNRVRMIVASFLVKNLRLPWQHGARWFWDTLVDADLASNTLGWQWAAGCGADAAPYFRIFNPVSQGRKFDPLGNYVRRFVPELRGLSVASIHAPWETSAAELAAAGIRLGQNYPAPIVDLLASRQAAMAAFRSLRV
jgi:deoxyribodipyrimidine photo-lyase